MIRNKSNVAVSILNLLELPEGSSRSPRSAYYEANKGADVSHYKHWKSYTLWLRHRTAAILANQRRALQLGVLLVLLVMTFAAMLLLRMYPRLWGQVHTTQHMVVLDAGSTGTRVHVFRYRSPSYSAYPLITLPEAKLKLEPGLSSFADNPAGVATPLKKLLDFAAAHVPSDEWHTTPVHLMATAGLRLLQPHQADAVLSHCREVLAQSPFKFQRDWVNIISGKQEGLFGWVAVNYAAGNLQAAAHRVGSRRDPSDRRLFHGLLEMGGASTQLTLMAEGSVPRASRKHHLRVRLPGVDWPLFSHSFLGYGFDVLERKVAEVAARPHPGSSASDAPAAYSDPCLPNGYLSPEGRKGAGDWVVCQRLISQLMDPALCRTNVGSSSSSSDCPEVPSVLPPLHGPLVAIENFYWTAQALQLPPHATLMQLSTAAANFCARPWSATLAAHGEPHSRQQYLYRYCYGAAVVFTLLQDVLRVPPHLPLHFSNTLRRPDGAEVGLDWALGAAVVAVAEEQQQHNRLFAPQLQRVLLLVGAVLLLMLVVRSFWPQGPGAVASDGVFAAVAPVKI